jgi:hypothetical protein
MDKAFYEKMNKIHGHQIDKIVNCNGTYVLICRDHGAFSSIPDDAVSVHMSQAWLKRMDCPGCKKMKISTQDFYHSILMDTDYNSMEMVD